MATDETIVTLFGNFSAMYPLAQSETPETVAAQLGIWRLVLADVPDEALQMAALEYLKSSSQWRPVAGQLRSRALELTGSDAKSRALAAWEEILSSDFGRHPVSDAIAVRAMRLAGGFEAFGQSEIAQQEWWQKRFIQFYDELAGKQDALALGAGNVQTASLTDGKR